MANPKKKSKEDDLIPNIWGKGFKDPFENVGLGFSNPKGKSGKNQMGDIPNLGSQIGKVDKEIEKVLTGFFNPNSAKGKKCEKCGVKKDDTLPLCRGCWEKENHKCVICGKPSGKYPKCFDCNNSNSPPQDPRVKYPATYRTDSGHYVRSKAEQAIANWFYKQDIIASYEKKFPEEYIICDFYLPKWDVWIEYWGMENEGYLENKHRKLAIYEKHKKNLINLYEADIQNNLEDLPQRLREFIPKAFNFR